MPTFTTLYEDLINNLRFMLRLPIPTSSRDYSNDLRHLESKILQNIENLKKYQQLKGMQIPGETPPPEEPSRGKKIIKKVLPRDKTPKPPPNHFGHYFGELERLAYAWDHYKRDPKSSEKDRDWKGDREKVKRILEKIQPATFVL